MRPKAPLCIDKKGCGLGKSRRDSRPLRGPTPPLGHAGRRLEGGAPGDGRNKFGLMLHAALPKRAVAWGEDVTLCPSYTLNSRMPSIALLAPVAIPLATAGAVAICGVAGWKIDRIVLAAGAWLAILALIALWAPVRSTQDLGLGQLGFSTPSELRLDAVGFAFGLMVLVPAAVLLTLQPRPWQEGTVAALAVAAAVLAVESGGVILTAVAGGAAATLAIVQLDVEDPKASRPPWGVLLAAWLALSWVGAILQVRSGTALYSAVPVSALTVPVFMVLAVGLPWLPDRAGPASLVVIAAAAGLPPGLAFGVRVLGLEAAFEAGNPLGLIGIGAAATWMVSIIAAARAVGLPAGRGHPASETKPRVAMGLAGATVIAGPALGLALAVLATPAQAVVMPAPAGSTVGGLTSVVTVSTVLPALALFAPVLLLAVVGYIYGGTMSVRTQPRSPLFVLPGTDRLARLREEMRAATVPAQYRSLVDLRALEAAATDGGPLLWLAALVALAFAVTR